MKAGFLAMVQSTSVGRGVLALRLGDAVRAVESETNRVSKLRARSVHRAPTRSSRARRASENATPPRPAALRIKPMAAPRRRSKYSGATLMSGK